MVERSPTNFASPLLIHSSIRPSINSSLYGFARFNTPIANALKPDGADGRMVCAPCDGLAGIWVCLLHLQYGRAKRMVQNQGALFYFCRSGNRFEGRRSG